MLAQRTKTIKEDGKQITKGIAMTTLINTLRADKMKALRGNGGGEWAKSILSVVIAAGQFVAMADKKNRRKEPTDEEMLTVLRKQVQSNAETLDLIKGDQAPARLIMSTKLQAENCLLAIYLPVELDEDSLRNMVVNIIGDIPEEERTMKSMGRIMKELKDWVAEEGLAINGKIASGIVKEMLT